MRHPLAPHELDGGSGCRQPRGILLRFVGQRVDARRDDHRRRGAGEIRGPQRRGPDGHRRGPDLRIGPTLPFDPTRRSGIPHVQPPVPLHALRGQRQVLGVGAVARAVGVGRVEHGAQQHLDPDAGSPALARTQGERGGEVAARAVSGDAQGRGIRDQTARAVGGEAQRAIEVVEPGGEGMLRREPVVDAQHLRAGGGGERAAQGVVVVEVARDPPAAVGEDEGSAVSRARPVHPQSQVAGRGVERLDDLVVGQPHPRRVRPELGDPRGVVALGIRRARGDRARLRGEPGEVRAHVGVGDRGVDAVAHGTPLGVGWSVGCPRHADAAARDRDRA
ncbi:hypothetical protein SRABI128_04305 [Microbacterium sp. Bi128]|nr:hypothetical protein SRABI128_04305 [Microbacterium sp. Bi128]